MNVDQRLARHELDRAVSVALGRSAVVAVTAPAGFGKTAAADHWRRFGVDDAGPGAQVEVVDDAHLQPERKLAARVAAARAGGPSVILLGRPAGGAFDAVAADPRTAAVGPQYLALDRRALRERFGDDGDAVYALTDEVYAITATRNRAEMTGARTLTIAVTCQALWVLPGIVGGLIGMALPAGLDGLQFALAALFTVLAVDAWRASGDLPAPVIGLICGLAAAWVAADQMMLVGLVGFVVVLLLRYALTARADEADA